MSKGQSCVYLSKQQTKNLKDFIYNSNIFTKAELDNMFSVLPNNYLEIMMSVLQTNYRRELNLDNSIDKGIIKDYIINKYNELNNKQGEDDIDYYTTGEVVSNEEVEELKSNNAGVFQSFIGNINNSLIQFRKAVFENAKKQGIEITDKKDSDFYKTITSLSDSIIKKLMKEGKVINITPNDKLSTNMAVQVTGDVITIIYNPLLVVRDADKFDAIISHELLHTVTASAVNNTQRNIANEEEQKFTQEIFDIVKELANKEDFYWDMGIDINSMRGKYKYIKEFIANVMSNEELRNHLSDIKYQEDNPDIAEEEKTSILNKVFKSIYNYVRSFYSKDTDKDLDQSYLEKLTEIIQSHIDTQPSNAFGTLSQYTEGKVGDASSVKSNWAQKVNDNYEVSSKGDKRFSALNATFKKGTVIDGTDVGGMTIEDVYQSVIKKSGKNQPPSKDSKLYKSELKTKEEKEDFSYYEGYLPLWQEWAKQNPELIEDLREKAKGKTLTDQFANTRVNQARALADILNNGYSSKNTSIATKNYTKTTPSENPNTNFVFTDNAQAYTALHDVEGVEKSQFNSPKEGIKLNVTANSNQAGIRMKDDSTANSNAYGLVVKKNQQDNDGKFIHQEGTFKDTDEDFNMFVTLNEHMFNRLEASDNKEIVFPSKIALGRAALPKRFAEWLQQQLKDRYGLDYDIVEHESNSKNEKYKYEGYGLKASNSNKDQSSTEKSKSDTKKTTSVKTGKTREEQKKEREDKENAKKKRALESYNKEAPKLNLQIDKSKLDSVLINNIPNLAQRVALEKAVYHLFTNYWDLLLQEAKENSKNVDDGNLSKIYDYILTGTQEEQKLKLLNTLTYVRYEQVNGQQVGTQMNAITYLMHTILDDIINFSSVTYKDTKTNTRGQNVQETKVNTDIANQVINYYLVQLDNTGAIKYDNNGVPLFNRNNPFGESFYLRYIQNNLYLKKDLKGLAIEFVKNLSTQIQPITDVETFKAVFIKSQRLLKHNDSIKVNFLNKGVFNNKSQSNLEEPQEDDRSGLSLVKFKTMEPSKRMSQRVRRILSQTPRYLNGKIQFNTLGLVEYLTPDVAYYQLVDKFATIRNEQDYNRLVESLSKEYPWFQFIKEKIDQDEIFRNDFYTAFRNVFNRYAIINNSGKVSYLNGEAAINILLDDTQSIYESGLLLNKYSIYNSDTTPNMTNIQKFRDNVLKGVLQNFSNNLKSIKDAKGKITNNTPQQLATLLKQLLVLSDYKIDDKKVFDSEVSLKSILNTFGVSTDKIDLSHLYTTIEEIEQYINNREDFKNNPIDLKSLINEEDNKDKDNKDKEAALLNAIKDTENLASVLIDYFTQKGVESKNNKLANMIDAMGKIVSKNTGFSSSNKNLIQSFYKQYLRILSPLKDTTEIYGTTTFQFDNNSRPSYSTPSYASDILRHLNSINTQEDLDNFRQWVDTEFTTYDFYKDDNGECNHLWIKTLLDYIGKKGEEKSIQEIKEFARNFDATEILGVGGSDEKKNSVGKVSNYTLLNSLIPAAYNATSTDPNYQFGYFRNPLYSDKDVLVLFKAPMFKGDRFEERVIDQLYKVWKSEYNRILFYTRREQFKNKINQIEGLETTGTKFHFFPEFNNDLFWEHLNNSTDTKSFVKEQIRELLESKFEAFYNEAYSKAGATKILNIIDRNSKKEENEGEILFESEEDSTKEDVELSKEEKEEKENEQFRLLYKQFYYNDFMNYIESIRLFQGDPALYGNSTALVKRGAQSHVFGQRGYFIDENGDPITERCMYMEDYYADSNSMASVMELLKQDTEIFSDLDKGMIEGLIRKTANYYKGICTTDGQSFRTLKSIKKILKGFGKLTPEVEESLTHIESKKMGSMDIVNIINALKPFLYSSERRDLKAGSADDYIERVEKVTTQHKNSEYALSALYSVLNSVLNRSNTLKGLQQFMEKNDIDVVHFKSVVKVGANNLFDLNNVYNPKLKEALGKRDNYTVSNNGKIIFPLKIQLGKDNIEEVKIEIPLEAYNKNEDAVYEYIRDFLKINPNRDSSLSKDELNKKQELYNAFQRQYGLESLSQEQLYKVLNYQFHSDEEGNYLPEHPNLNKIHTFKLQDYVIVQPVDDHYLDHEAIFGSQLRNIVPANLPDNFTCTLRIKGKEVQLNKEQTIELYNTLITDQLLDSYNEDLRKKFNSIKEFKKYIDDLVASNDKYGEDIYNALQLDESGTDFRMPLTSSNLSNKIDEIILSAAKNAIQRQKIKGGNIVLVSNFGFTNTLKTKTETVEVINDKGEKEERQRIKYIPCYAPMSMMQIYQDYLEEESDSKGNTWYTINFEKLKKSKNIDPKFLDMVGYRIPTENNYSIMPIRIVGILPQSMGSSIMLPQDIITMSGTDFDIDKLFLMLRTVFTEVSRSGKVAKAIQEALDNISNDKELEELYNSLTDSQKEQIQKNKKAMESKDFAITDMQLESIKKNPFIAKALEISSENVVSEPNERKIIVKNGRYVFNEDGTLNISESSRLSSLKNKAARKEVRDNMIIDIIEAIITSPYGSGRSQKPGQFDSLKRESLVHKIIDDPQAFEQYKQEHQDSNNILEDLMNKSDKYLKEFYEKYAEVQNPNDILWYINQHYNLMQGNDLIGGAAVASSNQLKLQNLPNFSLKKPLADQLPFKYKDKMYYLGSNGINRRLSPITGNTISDLYAEVQAAAPDNGKNPVLGYLGINLDNLYFVNYLIGLGLPIESISQILMIYKNLDQYKALVFDKNNKWNATQNNYLYNKETRPDGFDGDISKAVNTILTNPDFIKEHSTYIRGFLNMLISLDEQARVLNNISSYSRVDSTNGALPVLSGEAIQYRLKVQKFIDQMNDSSFPFNGLKEFIDTSIDPETQFINSNGEISEEFRQKLLKSPISRMQAMYSLGIVGASTLASRWLISMNPSIIQNLQKIATENGINLLGKKGLQFINNYLKNIPTYLMSSNEWIGDHYDKKEDILMTQSEKSNYYIHDFPIKFYNKLPALRDKYPDISIFKNLIVSQKKGIILQSISNITEQGRAIFREELEDMLKTDDKTLNDIASDLFLYSYYKTGLQYKHNSYGILFSTFFLDMLGDVIPDLKTATKKFGNYVDNENGWDLNRYSFQFLVNNINLLYKVHEDNVEIKYSTDSQGNTTRQVQLAKSKDEEKLLKHEYIGKNGKTALKYIIINHKEKDPKSKGYKIKTVLYELNKVENGYYSYTPINFNRSILAGRDSYRPYYNRNADNQEFNKEIFTLKSQGEVMRIKASNNAKENSKNKQNKQSMNSVDNYNVDRASSAEEESSFDINDEMLKRDMDNDSVELPDYVISRTDQIEDSEVEIGEDILDRASRVDENEDVITQELVDQASKADKEPVIDASRVNDEDPDNIVCRE